MLEQLPHLGAGESVTGPLAVDAGPPECLVGIDVAHARDQALVEQLALDPGRAAPHPGDELIVVELGVERVASDVRDLRRQLGATGGDRQAAEHPLVGEPQLDVGCVQDEPDPQVPLGGGVGRLDEELTAHAEVSEQCVAVVERQPEVLAPPAGALDPATGQRGGEALRPARVAAHGPRVQYLDAGDGAAHCVPLEAHAHHFDLGQLGH